MNSPLYTWVESFFRSNDLSTELLSALFLHVILFIWAAAILTLTVPLGLRAFRIWRQRRLIRASFDGEMPTREERELIEKELIAKRWSRPIWAPFLRTWRELADPIRGVAAHHIEFLRFCTPDRVVPGVANRRLASVTPGILVALGIFGTFLGLAVALPQGDAPAAGVAQEERQLPAAAMPVLPSADDPPAEEGLPGPNTAEQITTMIGGLKFAFMTSLLGILGSLLFMFFDRTAFHVLQRQVLKLSWDVDAVFPSVDPAVAGAREARSNEQLTTQLKTLATDIAVALENTLGKVMSGAVGEAMDRHLAPIITELKDVVDKLSGTVSKEMVTALESFSDRINDNLMKTFREQFQHLGENLTELVATQNTMRDLLEESSGKMAEQARTQERLADQLIAAGSALEGLLDGLREVTAHLGAASSRAREAAEGLTDSARANVEAQKEISEIQRRLSVTVQHDLEQLKDAREEILENWKRVSAEAKDSIQIVQQSVRDLGEVVEHRLIQALGSFDAKLGEAMERFSGTLHEARETINELPAHVQALGEGAGQMAGAVGHLREEILAAFSGFESSLDASVERAREAHERLDQAVSAATAAAESLKKALDRRADEKDAVVAELRQVRHESTAAREAIQGIAGTVGKLGNVQDNTDAVVETLRGINDKLEHGGDGDLQQIRDSVQLIAKLSREPTTPPPPAAPEAETQRPEPLEPPPGSGLLKRLFGRGKK